jgi:hypothetical protein
VVTRLSLVDLLLDSEPSEQTRDLAMAIVAIDRRAPKTSKPTQTREPIQISEPTHNANPIQTSEPTHNANPIQTSEPTHNGKPIRTSEPTQIGEPIGTSEPTQIGEPTQPSAARSEGRAPRTNSTRRALAITGLGGLLIAGATVITTSGSGTAPSANGHGSAAFGNAHTGDCLSWPKNSPDQAHLVDCNAEHLFEVAQSVDMSDSQQGCQPAVQRYLGTRYDPNGKFAIGVLRPGDAAGSQSAGQHPLCGLQLPGSDKQPVAFKGKIAELDQSRVWPAGTCLAVDPSSNLADITVGCSAPHAQEITGALNLAEAWPGPPPSQPDQDAFIRDACTRATDAYLSPVALPTTGLTLIYSAVPPPSWLAGSRQVSCGIGAPLGDQGSATLNGSAKDRLLINGVAPGARPAAPPQDAPDQRPDTPSTAASSPSSALSTTASPSPTPSPARPANPSPPLSANPSPAPSATSDADAPQVIEIPGLAPITLPRLLPPPPPPGD